MLTVDGVDKPLAEWTINELQNHCIKWINTHPGKPCDWSCPLYSKFCQNDWVHDWDLSEKPKFTEQEIFDANELIRFLDTLDGSVMKDNEGNVIVKYSRHDIGGNISINNNLFPSIKRGQKYQFLDILGESDA